VTESSDQYEASLLGRVQEGDDAAFTELLERYRALLLNFVYRLLGGDAATAEDVAQEAFVRAYQHAGEYRPDQGSVRTWLFALARHRAIDEVRRRRRHPTASLEAAPTPAAPPHQGVAEQSTAREVGTEIAAAVAALPEDQRTTVILTEYHGLSHAEVAAVLGSSEKSVESRLYRARQTLREKLRHLME